ncbi:MAG TPA: translation initiation factor IF-2 [Candidatus Saccharicenans sp.]|jgi:translation initiation factor IF-2|nr:translation initiation factor IF-2 [Candidatus Saccharicenans sp.]HOL44883.1 translation initiation factor IF-2 [Candidatus Saccharicenans sp.]HOM93886.1 translation initiation factor IF-2 [Candidatus Saccharicenans sp.]HOT68700.1 translation initiation factor IF-2 [Candidatus Saccharicenans sp.]HPP23251.1 translation initiation factor IF-2 [Candidatus Saccharicenans sp.]
MDKSKDKTTTKSAVPAKKKVAKAETAAGPRPKVQIQEGSTVKDVADRFKIKPKDLVDHLVVRGYDVSASDLVDEKLLRAISDIIKVDLEMVSLEEDIRKLAFQLKDSLVPRPPVVTIMGHVDHGKTTLLDAIRSSNLTEKEAGGITQHIGAYRAKYKNRYITFIDTPGHEAFTQLRARGAKVTDIVVLVVAADDGVMPQTREAISHAQAANVPIIVAINKIDKPDANPERVKQQLAKEGLIVEEWGGKTISVDISAKEKKNIDELLEMILLLGDILELKSNPYVPAQGVILESRLDAQKGPVATVIIQLGTLRPAEAFICGHTYGKARALLDEFGRPVKEAGPSVPVEVLGFNDVPPAGTFFQVVPGIDIARRISEFRMARARKETPEKQVPLTLEDLFKKIEKDQTKELNVIVKADVNGSVEVLRDLLPTLSTDKVKINVLQASTGNVTEADVLLASASGAIIIGYNVKVPPKIQEIAKNEKVEIRLYKIIYQLTDDLKKAVAGMLEPVIKETYLGRAVVKKIFNISRVGTVLGCQVIDGKMVRNAEVRVIRGNQVLYQTRISSLKHVKDNVTEVKRDAECGLGLEKTQDIQAGDILEAFVREKVMPT